MMEISRILFDPEAWLLPAGAWFLTYMIHSTVWLGGVLIVMKMVRSEVLRERLWKFALWGGAVSVTLQMILGVEPAGGKLLIENGAAASPGIVEDTSGYRVVNEEFLRGTGEGNGEVLILSPSSKTESQAGNVDSYPAGLKKAWHSRWPGFLAGLGLAGTGLAFMMMLWAWLRFRYHLRGCRDLREGTLRAMLDRLCSSAGFPRPVRLTVSGRTRVPLAMGILKHEICLPERVLVELGPLEQKSMLAHELAHLKRRDPLWLALFRLAETIFIFQPLHRLARKCWLETAEFRCDRFAAELVGGGLPLARCLTEVAEWLVGSKADLEGAAAHGMARNPSSLSRRVTRLLEAPRKDGGAVSGSVLGILLAGFLLATVGAAPGVSVGHRTGMPEEEEEIIIEEVTLPDAPDLYAGISEALDRDLAALDDEIVRLRIVIWRAGFMDELGGLLREAEARSEALRAKKDRILRLIRRRLDTSPKEVSPISFEVSKER